MEDIVVELGFSIMYTLENCKELLVQNVENRDIVLTRIESALVALAEIRADQFVSWGAQIENKLENIIELLLDFEQLITVNKGRPKILVPTWKIEWLLSMNFKVTEIAKIFGVSARTISNKMREINLSVRESYTNITDECLSTIMLQILQNQPNTGYKRMKGHLLHRQIKVTEQRVRELMRYVDPVGVYQRTVTKNHQIRRRKYFVEHSNQIWHIDGNHKLIRWGIVVRSGIDGKSRTVTYMEATDNNRADTHLQSFLRGVQEFGLPLRTRSDKGKENIEIARFMIENRGTGRRSHICGRSVHNQRIERHWRDLYFGCLSTYYNLFSALEEDGLLILENSKHLELLHRIFLPRLNEHLSEFVNGWNNHPLSTEHNKTPFQLMILHLPPPEMDMELQEDDYFGADFLFNSTADLNFFEMNSSTGDVLTDPQPPSGSLNHEEIERLSLINLHRESDSFGYDIFEEGLNCLDIQH